MSRPPKNLVNTLREWGQWELADGVLATHADREAAEDRYWDSAEDAMFAADAAYSYERDRWDD